MIHFLLLVNKQGQTRLAQYAQYMDLAERTTLEGEVVRKCLQRKETECSFIEHLHYKLVYRRYAALFFIVGVDGDENELAILEFIHVLVETLDRYARAQPSAPTIPPPPPSVTSSRTVYTLSVQQAERNSPQSHPAHTHPPLKTRRIPQHTHTHTHARENTTTGTSPTSVNLM